MSKELLTAVMEAAKKKMRFDQDNTKYLIDSNDAVRRMVASIGGSAPRDAVERLVKIRMNSKVIDKAASTLKAN